MIGIRLRDPQLQDAVGNAVRRLGYELRELRADAAACDVGSLSAVIVDDGLPDLRQTVGRLRDAAPAVGLIVLSGRSDARSVVEALELGADEVLRKPFDVAQLARALDVVTASLVAGPPIEVIAESPRMQSVLRKLAHAAESDLTVTISGEPGSGRSLLSRWLHARGRRRRGRLVEISALELDPETCRAELWGDSARRGLPGRPGRLEQAHRGTLVLDGIDRFPEAAQDAILSLFHPVGHGLDVRVIATTERPLAELAGSELLPTLCQRLAVVEVEVPPLRERPEDIEGLARCFLQRAARDAGSPVVELGDAASALLARRWRGNVRELENLMRRAAVEFPGAAIDPAWLEQPRSGATAAAPSASLNLRELERAAIARALHWSGGSRTEAARALGINVRTLRNKIQRYQLA